MQLQRSYVIDCNVLEKNVYTTKKNNVNSCPVDQRQDLDRPTKVKNPSLHNVKQILHIFGKHGHALPEYSRSLEACKETKYTN